MDGGAGYPKNISVKMPGSQLKEKLFNMFRSEMQEKQTNIDTQKK